MFYFLSVWVPFFSWTFSYSVSCVAPRLQGLFTLVLRSSMVLPVAAVHRGVAGEADGEGDTGRSHHQGRLREKHLTSLSKIDSQTTGFFFKEQSERFFSGYEPRLARKSGGELQISKTRILREDNSVLLSLELPPTP